MLISGLIGKPVTHSLGQKIYNRIFTEKGLNYIYLSIDIDRENLEIFFNFARENMSGFNITAPYKEDSAKYMDFMDDISRNTGSINLVKVNNGKLYGFNSDYTGFLFLLRHNNIDLNGKKVLILGTGGAARTLAYAINRNFTADPSMVSREPDKRKINGINIIGYDDINEYDILINATPLGTFPDKRIAIPESKIYDNITAIDIVYNPPLSPFLKKVNEHHGKAVNGMDMFVGQGIETLEKIYNIKITYESFMEKLMKQ